MATHDQRAHSCLDIAHTCSNGEPPAPHHAAGALLEHVLVLLWEREQRVVQRACGMQQGGCWESIVSACAALHTGSGTPAHTGSAQTKRPKLLKTNTAADSRKDSSMTRKKSRPSVLRALRSPKGSGMRLRVKTIVHTAPCRNIPQCGLAAPTCLAAARRDGTQH